MLGIALVVHKPEFFGDHSISLGMPVLVPADLKYNSQTPYASNFRTFFVFANPSRHLFKCCLI